MADNPNSGGPVDEIRELREKVEELTRNQKTLTRNQELMDRRQLRLRAFVWGTDKGSYYDENGQGGIKVRPHDARSSDDNLRADFTLPPDQPSVMERISRSFYHTSLENRQYLRYVEAMSLKNKQRSEKNEKELDKSLEKRAKRFLGFGKKKKSLHEELRF